MGQLSFAPHPLAIAAILVSILLYPVVSSVDGTRRPFGERFGYGWRQTSPKLRKAFFFAMLSLLVANYWPVADLARNDLLLARLFQQLLITLSAAPLLLLSIPRRSIVVLTRPKIIDHLLRRFTRPAPAIVIFTAVVILAMTPAGVVFENSSVLAEQVAHLALLVAGVLAWIPILRIMPGIRQLTTVGRLGYLFVLSLLPNVPAIVLIFARRPLYSVYSHSSLGIGAVADQQLTGAAAKIISLAVFWGVAIYLLLKADRDEGKGLDPDPITWDDVQRELDRSADRNPRG